MKVFQSHSVAETFQVARDFSTKLKAGDKVALCGELGSGKTHFAKGFIAALSGIAEAEIPSPTFTLIEEYAASIPVYHLDLYRLNKTEELEELDQDILFGKAGITLIEWAERFPDVFNACFYKIHFYKEGADNRRIEITETSC